MTTFSAPTSRRPASDRRNRVVITAAVVTITAAAITAAMPLTTSTATAAPGDIAVAETIYLDGSLAGSDLSDILSMGHEQATSDGTTSTTNSGNLDVGLLGVKMLDIGGGVQIPLDSANAGLIGQYAHANETGYSLASTGLIDENGGIGTGITPTPGIAPGALTLKLDALLNDLGLPSTTLTNLQLSFDGVSATAQQQAPKPATGDYAIEAMTLTLNSPLVADLAAATTTTVTELNNTLNLLDGVATAEVESLLGVPVELGAVTVNIPNLDGVIAPLSADITSTDPACAGVSVNLSTGIVRIDLAAITQLNNQPPNTSILTDEVLTTIGNRIDCLLTETTTKVISTLRTAVETTTITVAATVPLLAEIKGAVTLDSNGTVQNNLTVTALGLTPVNIDPTLGQATSLLESLTATIDVLDAVLTADVADITSSTSGIGSALSALNDEVDVTVNNQTTDQTGRFTETALRVAVQPGSNALSLDVANATVGKNQSGSPTVLSLTPNTGPEAGGQTVTITGTNFTEATGVTFDGVAGTGFTVVDDNTIKVITPPHVAGPVDVIVQHPNGNRDAIGFTYQKGGTQKVARKDGGQKDGGQATVKTVDPNRGPANVSTGVAITGTCFTGLSQVLFGDVAADIVRVSDTEVYVLTPPHAPGTVDVTIRGSKLCGDHTMDNGFTYEPTIGGGHGNTLIAPDRSPKVTPDSSNNLDHPVKLIVPKRLPEAGSAIENMLIIAGLLVLTGSGLMLGRRRFGIQ